MQSTIFRGSLPLVRFVGAWLGLDELLFPGELRQTAVVGPSNQTAERARKAEFANLPPSITSPIRTHNPNSTRLSAWVSERPVSAFGGFDGCVAQLCGGWRKDDWMARHTGNALLTSEALRPPWKNFNISSQFVSLGVPYRIGRTIAMAVAR
jgi:hypothetical protein